MTSEIATFLGIVVVLTITPGVDMALIMRSVLGFGLRAAWPTMAGILTGVSIHVTLCVAGLSVLLRNSDVAFTTVRLAGAAWLAWMGISTLWSMWRERATARQATTMNDAGAQVRLRVPAPKRWVLYRRGLLTNLLNVKIALFYIAFLPQFAPAGDHFVPIAIGLAAVQAAIGMAWLASYAVFIDRAGRMLEASPRVRLWLEGSTGAALLGFGLRLATATR